MHNRVSFRINRVFLTTLCCLVVAVSSAQAAEQLRAENIQVMAPVLVEAGKDFSVLYKTVPNNRPITLSNRIQVTWPGSKTSASINLEGEEKAVEADKRTVSLKHIGKCNILLDFTDMLGNSLQKTLNVVVVPEEEASKWKDNQVWNIPEGKIIFSNEDGSTTDLAFAKGVLRKLKPQPNAEDQWTTIECWNTLALLLKPQWLPPIENIRAFVDISHPSLTRVGYCAYSAGDVRIVSRMELGKQTWVYIEADTEAKRFSTPEKRADFFSTSLLSSQKRGSYLARLFERKKLSLSESRTKNIDILLIHATDEEAINLRYPGY